MQEKIPFQAGAGLVPQQEDLLSQRHFPTLASPSRCSEILFPAREGTRGSREFTLCLEETRLLLIRGKEQSEDTTSKEKIQKICIALARGISGNR